MDDKFKKNLVKFYALMIIVLLILISFSSCKKQKIEPEPETPKIRVQNMNTDPRGMIRTAEVLISPVDIEKRFFFVNYDLVGRDDSYKGKVVFKENFSDTLDLKYDRENLIGNKTYFILYKNLENVYSLEIHNGVVKVLE